jgi:UbiD family decarboxylase
MSEDFRGFLKEMEETKEGGFVRIKKEVDTRYEIAAIVTKLERSRRVPLLLFEDVKGSSMPVVVNCYATRGRVARPSKKSPSLGAMWIYKRYPP